MILEIHRASEEEILAADRNSYEVWGGDLSLEQYIERCKTSVRRNRAQCWVLRVDGVVVSSLGCHPLFFWHKGVQYPGFGIASVYTNVNYRKQGLAEQLCRTVMNREQSKGAQFGLLFSDVPPAYYQKMGFNLHSEHSYEYQDIEKLSRMRFEVTLQSFVPEEELSWLHNFYQEAHQEKVLSVARNEEYWSYSVQANSADQFCMILNKQNKRIGYVRLLFIEERAILKECIVQNSDDTALISSVYSAVAELLFAKNIRLLQTWQPPPSGLQGCFYASTRDHALPMIWKGEQIQDTAEMIASEANVYSSDYF